MVSPTTIEPTVPKEWHILNLGAGVQSTALYLMACESIETGVVPRFDYAVFADTKGEPAETYAHLKWLKTLNGPRIITVTRGSLRAQLLNGQPGSTRSVSIPCYTKDQSDEKEGKTRRQCTREYKIDVIERWIRRTLLGMRPGQVVPKGIRVNQYFGISADEMGRSGKILKQFNKKRWAKAHFPLISLGWSRRGCKMFLAGRVPHEVKRSRCFYCPLQDDHEWADQRDNDPNAFERACKLDDLLRKEGTACNRGMDKPMYLHRSCIPLRMVDFDNLPPQQLDGFTLYDCSGACGV